MHTVCYNATKGCDIMAIDCKKLKEKRNEAKLTQQEMAQKLGIAQRSYASYELGERDMGTDMILKICSVLHISSDELLGIYSQASSYEEIKTISGLILSVIPLYSTAEQFYLNKAEDQFPDLFETNKEARETIAVRVSGESMSPKIDDRNTVTVHVQKSFRNGDIIALTIEDKKNIFVRRARRDGSDIILEPGNSEYETMRYNEERIHIIGVVKKIIKSI